MNEQRTKYQSIRHHWAEILATVRYAVTQLADEAIEIAARAVMLAAPMPNAISMYNITQREQGFEPFQAFAFSLTLEIVVFLLVEIALVMWDGYLAKPDAYKWPFTLMVSVVVIATVIVIAIVYNLEPHKIMALLPVISLCAFAAIGLKRWHERNQAITEPAQPVTHATKPKSKPVVAQPPLEPQPVVAPVAVDVVAQPIYDATPIDDEPQPVAIMPELQAQLAGLDATDNKILNALRNGACTPYAISKATNIALTTLKRKQGDKVTGRLPKLVAAGYIRNSSGVDGSEYRLVGE
jgi:hypothetical protein